MAFLKAVFVAMVTFVTFGESKMVDMTHNLNKNSRHFQSFRDFELTVAVNTSFGALDNLWLLAKDFSQNEHTGTHIDAPIHTFRDRSYLHQIPLERLMGPAVVFDISRKDDPDYVLTIEDIKEHEEKYGRIEDGSIILIYTEGAEVYGDINKYYGTDTPDDLTSMHFPGFGGPATEWLIDQRKIRGIGTDRMSFDSGTTLEYPAHLHVSKNDVWGLENVNKVGDLPPRGATVFVMPIKLEFGTGGPVRMVAFTDMEDLPFYSSLMSAAPSVNGGMLLILLASFAAWIQF